MATDDNLGDDRFLLDLKNYGFALFRILNFKPDIVEISHFKDVLHVITQLFSIINIT